MIGATDITSGQPHADTPRRSATATSAVGHEQLRQYNYTNTMPTLSYSGRLSIETNSDGTIPQAERDKLHTLLDDAIAAYEGDDVTLRTAVVHFERNGAGVGTNDMPRAHVDLEAEGSIAELSTVEDTLAQQVVAIGLEPDVQTAKDSVQVN